MATTRARRRRRGPAFWTIPLGLLASGLMVWQSSTAAFTASTTNPRSSWTAGGVAITDDDGKDVAMFALTDLRPGSTGERCITVEYTGTVPADIRLFGLLDRGASGPDLRPALELTVEEGSGGSFDDGCAGFRPSETLLPTMPATKWSATTFETGLGSWAPTGSGADNRTYRITYTMDPAADNAFMNASASATLTWEARSR